MVSDKKQRLIKRDFLQVGIKNPSEKGTEGKRRNYKF
jgi:hypothetical protein